MSVEEFIPFVCSLFSKDSFQIIREEISMWVLLQYMKSSDNIQTFFDKCPFIDLINVIIVRISIFSKNNVIKEDTLHIFLSIMFLIFENTNSDECLVYEKEFHNLAIKIKDWCVSTAKLKAVRRKMNEEEKTNLNTSAPFILLSKLLMAFPSFMTELHLYEITLNLFKESSQDCISKEIIIIIGDIITNSPDSHLLSEELAPIILEKLSENYDLDIKTGTNTILKMRIVYNEKLLYILLNCISVVSLEV